MMGKKEAMAYLPLSYSSSSAASTSSNTVPVPRTSQSSTTPSNPLRSSSSSNSMNGYQHQHPYQSSSPATKQSSFASPRQLWLLRSSQRKSKKDGGDTEEKYEKHRRQLQVVQEERREFAFSMSTIIGCLLLTILGWWQLARIRQDSRPPAGHSSFWASTKERLQRQQYQQLHHPTDMIPPNKKTYMRSTNTNGDGPNHGDLHPLNNPNQEPPPPKSLEETMDRAIHDLQQFHEHQKAKHDHHPQHHNNNSDQKGEEPLYESDEDSSSDEAFHRDPLTASEEERDEVLEMARAAARKEERYHHLLEQEERDNQE